MLCCGHVGLFGADLPSPRSIAGIESKIDAVIDAGKKQKRDGQFEKAAHTLQFAVQLAEENHENLRQARALLALGACQIVTFHYRQAIYSLNLGQQLASLEKDNSVAGAIAINQSTVYSQLGDFSAASQKARHSVELLRKSVRRDYLVQALINYGDVQAQQSDPVRAVVSYREAIAFAKAAGLAGAESAAELHSGESSLDAGDYSGAEQTLKRAEQLFFKDQDTYDLASTRADLAELEFDRKQYSSALQTLDSAINSRRLTTIPPYIPTHLRGQIFLAMGRQWDALAEFRKAANQASQWRQGALPGDATSIRTVCYLHNVYQDFTALAAGLAITTHNTALAREAIEVLADNRAASLREELAVALDRRGTLPPEYFQLLSQLQAAQAHATLSPNRESQAKLEQVRLQISEQENRFGINPENFSDRAEKLSSRKSLRSIQRGLTSSELLLSFCLGKDKSFLWAITNEQVKLYELPPESMLAMHAEVFSDAIRRGNNNTAHAGRVFSNDLFAHVNRNLLQHPDWLIVGDGALLNSVPFSALPEPSGSGDVFLAVNHRMRFLPSEALLGGSGPSATPRPEFVGIADPIYNLADSRTSRNHFFVNAAHSATSVALARLVGSDREVRAAAKMSGLAEAQFLVGADATSSALRSSLSSRPEIIHFAVHVVSPEGKPEDAALALSLTNDDIPELLTPEAISAFRIPNSLVVLSGCSSQQGKAVPSAGLIGLSRAWLLAGASAVVVSAWPTPDDSGQFFSSFYSHLETKTLTSESLADRAAAALELAQKDMQRNGGYRSSPSFWAAYSIISKE